MELVPRIQSMDQLTPDRERGWSLERIESQPHCFTRLKASLPQGFRFSLPPIVNEVNEEGPTCASIIQTRTILAFHCLEVITAPGILY